MQKFAPFENFPLYGTLLLYTSKWSRDVDVHCSWCHQLIFDPYSASLHNVVPFLKNFSAFVWMGVVSGYLLKLILYNNTRILCVCLCVCVRVCLCVSLSNLRYPEREVGGKHLYVSCRWRRINKGQPHLEARAKIWQRKWRPGSLFKEIWYNRKVHLRTPCVQTIFDSNNWRDVVLQMGAQ